MGKAGKPRGRMTAYAFFVQTCREEHKKKHPGESVVFAEFSKKCAEKWKSMSGPKDKKRFDDMATKDKARFEAEMADYVPPPGETKRKRKKQKDPNAPKRALSAFFFFCAEERPAVRKVYPDYGVGDVAKELGKRWEVTSDRTKYDGQAQKDKKRYEQEMAVYRGAGGGGPSKKAKAAPPPPPPPEEEEDEEEDEEEEEEDDDE